MICFYINKYEYVKTVADISPYSSKHYIAQSKYTKNKREKEIPT